MRTYSLAVAGGSSRDAVLHFDADVDTAALPDPLEYVDIIAEEHPTRVVLDLTKCRLLDAQLSAHILLSVKIIRAQGTTVVVRGCRSDIERMLRAVAGAVQSAEPAPLRVRVPEGQLPGQVLDANLVA